MSWSRIASSTFSNSHVAAFYLKRETNWSTVYLAIWLICRNWCRSKGKFTLGTTYSSNSFTESANAVSSFSFTKMKYNSCNSDPPVCRSNANFCLSFVIPFAVKNRLKDRFQCFYPSLEARNPFYISIKKNMPVRLVVPCYFLLLPTCRNNIPRNIPLCIVELNKINDSINKRPSSSPM